MWNLKKTKLEYIFTWETVLYWLRIKFPNHPDFQQYFDPIELTPNSSFDSKLGNGMGEEEEPSSDEATIYEYDVLLYLKEDIARRNKKRTIKDIHPCRKCLQFIIIKITICWKFIYDLLILLPKYMCYTKKPDKDDRAFKKPKRVSRNDVLKYLKKDDKEEATQYDHKISPPWNVVAEQLGKRFFLL